MTYVDRRENLGRRAEKTDRLSSGVVQETCGWTIRDGSWGRMASIDDQKNRALRTRDQAFWELGEAR